MKNAFLAGLTIGLILFAGATWGEVMIANGGFEEDADKNGMADHWQYAGDDGVVATWGLDTGFEGRFSQKLDCTKFTSLSPASHAMICQINTVKLERGKWYKLFFAARQQGIVGGALHAAISNTKSWTNCGLQESARIRGKWKKFEFVFRATETVSDNTRLQFWYTSAGILWLDDVRIEPAEPVVKRFTEVIPTGSGVNLAPNSSFECGPSGWGSIAELPGWGGNLNLLVGAIDTTAGKFGASSFKIVLTPKELPVFYFDYFPLYRAPVKAPLAANRGWITVEPGADYTLSAYMKADADGLVGMLAVRQAFRRNLSRQERLTTQWRRYTFSFKPAASQVFVALGADLEASKREEGIVWIDAVQLEKGAEATPYKPRAQVEVGLETNRLGNLFSFGDEPKMTATVFNSGKTVRTVTLNIRTTDFDDAAVYNTELSMDVRPGQTVKIPVTTGVRKKGFYRLHLTAEGAEVLLTRPMRFAIIQPYAKSDSLFGMNHAYPWAHMLDLSKRIGLCWFRDWSLKWHDVEPEKGKFQFAETDRQIDRVLDRGLKVIALLPFPSTNWSSSAGAEIPPTTHYPENRQRVAYMPKDLNDLAAYVRTTVGHYKGRLKTWEILNEPIFTDYALPRRNGYQVRDYVKFLKVAYQSVKAVDADATVIGGIAGGPATYTKEFIEAGGLDYVDVLNLHAYPGLKSPEAFEQPLRLLRERMRSAGAEKPIWFTEGAYYADDDEPIAPHDSTWLTPVDSETEAAEWQVKFNTLLLAYGAEKIIYHSGTPGSLNNESLSGIFFEWASAPRKMLVAQSAMANLLSPPIKSLGRVAAAPEVYAFGFLSSGRRVIVAWLKEGSPPRKTPLAQKPFTAFDIQGNELKADAATLSERPVYFISKETSGDELPW